MNHKSSPVSRKISAPTITKNTQTHSNPSTMSPMCSPGRSEKNQPKIGNKTPEKATNRTHENALKNQNTSKSPQRPTFNSSLQKPVSHSSKFLAQQKNHNLPTSTRHSQAASSHTSTNLAKENNPKMAHSPASKASSQNPTAMPSPAISHIPFEEQSSANQTFPSSFFINENTPQLQSSAYPSYLNFFDSAPKTSTKNTLSIFFPHEEHNLKITKRPENLLSEKKVEEKISEIQTSISVSPKEKERKMNLLKHISHGSVSRPKERPAALASSIDRHDFYSDDFSLKSLASKSNADRPRTNSVKSSQNMPQTTETVSKQSISQQERSETFSPERFIKTSKEKSQDRLQATSSSPSRESPRFGSHYKINPFTSESAKNTNTRTVKVKELITNFPDYDQNVIRNINTNPKNIKEVPKLPSQESSSGLEQKESSSTLKSFLVEPRSTNYGKFSKIYKGIENKDSWRFNFQRFQKLERKSSKASKAYQSPESPTTGKGLLNVEQSCTKPSASPYGLEELGLSISKDSAQESRERNSSSNSTKLMGKSQPTTYRNFFSSAANSTNTSLTMDKKAYGSHVTTPKKEKEENACGDTLNYLLSLKEKGLLGKKIGENDLEIEQILNGLKKEVDELNGVNDIQKRTELEEKLMLLLEMTVQGMASLVAKKNKTFQKYQQRGNSVNV